jgi:serine/threonine-protein kinase
MLDLTLAASVERRHSEHQGLVMEDVSTEAFPGTIAIRSTDGDLSRHYFSGFNKYENFKLLCEGGTATIHTCFDKNLQRTVAMKMLHPHLRQSELATKRFLREARVTAMIQHPGTVPVYEVGRDRRGDLYFTMKKLEGRDLRAIIIDLVRGNPEVRAQFSPRRLLGVIIQASQTIAYAHKHGVIHRDLKPANIEVGEFGEVMVLDWGLAKVRSMAPEGTAAAEADKSMSLTLAGQHYGTPLYMSPEQARGDEDIDERTDVYNLGSVLFSAITLHSYACGQPIGTDPTGSVKEIIDAVLEGKQPGPRQVAPKEPISEELERVCLRALARDREDRFADVPSFAEALRHCYDEFLPPERSGPPSILPPPGEE